LGPTPAPVSSPTNFYYLSFFSPPPWRVFSRPTEPDLPIFGPQRTRHRKTFSFSPGSRAKTKKPSGRFFPPSTHQRGILRSAGASLVGDRSFSPSKEYLSEAPGRLVLARNVISFFLFSPRALFLHWTRSLRTNALLRSFRFLAQTF